jgi:hypothetical protein
MCEDIQKELAKLGGRWVVNQALYIRSARYVIPVQNTFTNLNASQVLPTLAIPKPDPKAEAPPRGQERPYLIKVPCKHRIYSLQLLQE